MNYFFVGIGGIGMSAIARHFLAQGEKVGGYDRTRTHLTRELEAEGANILYDDDDSLIDNNFRNPEDTRVIVTPAVPQTSRILCYFRAHGHRVEKRAVALGSLTDNRKTVCVAGTHGKTTTSTLVAHILSQTPEGCLALLGGVARNYETNYLARGRQDTCVTEADEYDRSFLQLHPYAAAITAMDADHLDIYGTHAAVIEAFLQFAAQVKPGGLLCVRKGLPIGQQDVQPGVRVLTYSAADATADCHALKVKTGEGKLSFDVLGPDWRLEGISTTLPGLHNVENIVAAVTLARDAGATNDTIKQAIATFLGDRRRFELHYESASAVVIDDYAHHPQEIRATIAAARLRYPGRNLTVCFQPHLYTRTRDLCLEFAAALNLADRVLLLDIYPAREAPIEGVDSAMLRDRMAPGKATLTTKEHLVGDLLSKTTDVVLVMGAGDIELLVPAVTDAVSRLDRV